MSIAKEEVLYKRKEIPEDKQQIVNELVMDLTSHQVIGLVRLEQISSKILQKVRKQLRGKVKIKVTKNTLKLLALDATAKKAKAKKLLLLKDEIKGSNALILTDINPFRLAAFLRDNKVPTPAKSGMIAPEDVVVPAGNTGIQPGPIISEFGAVGLPTRIDAGQIRITKDTTVVRQGEKISRILAVVLSRLKMEPFKIGLTLYAAYDAGIILTEKDLEIDFTKTEQDLQKAYNHALNLSFSIYIPTSVTIKYLLTGAAREAINLAFSANIPTPDSIKALLKKHHTNVLLLASLIEQIDPNAAIIKNEVKVLQEPR
ncbi:MAG: 50S ribosomal protein L10 [Candidatus Heimdallarchaeota archaeon]